MVQRNEECVRVVVRCRPMSEKETAQGHKKVIQIDSKVRSLIWPEGFVEEYGFILTLGLFWKKGIILTRGHISDNQSDFDAFLGMCGDNNESKSS